MPIQASEMKRCPTHGAPLVFDTEPKDGYILVTVHCEKGECALRFQYELHQCTNRQCTQGCQWRDGPCVKYLEIVAVLDDGCARVRCPHRCSTITVQPRTAVAHWTGASGRV